MTDPNWHPNWTDAAPAQEPRCPPCNGNCLQGRGCEAGALIETPRGGLIVMAVIIGAVLAVVALLVWPR